MTPYTLRDASVLYLGRDELHAKEVSDAVVHALRRKLRLARFDKDFFRDLDVRGEAAITWNFTRFNRHHDDEWVTFHAWRHDDGTHFLHCVGPRAHDAIERVNKALFDKTPKWLKKKLQAEEDRRAGKKKRRKKTRVKELASEQVKKPKKAPKVASHRLEDLTPQFKKSRVFFEETLDAVVEIFGIVRDGKNTARQIAARRLYRSLEHTDYAFAVYRKGDFRLQFTLVDGRWRGIGLTPVTIACTKDNRSPHYRKMRRYFKKLLCGHPQKETRPRYRELFADRLAA